jgi:ribosome-binding protein aMBF1 (putative translation factor)
VSDRDECDDRDELEDHIAERARVNPEFPALVDAHLQRRRLQRALAGKRQELGISQTEVARRMSTSQSAVARIEAGEVDAKVSTLQRYAVALGLEIEFSLRPAS